MRHRRGFFSSGRGHYGNDRENRSHYRERMPSREPLSHREERMLSRDLPCHREERMLSREQPNQRVERTVSCEEPHHREEKDYNIDRSRYGNRTDTRQPRRSLGLGHVNIGHKEKNNRYDIGTNADLSVESFRTYLNNKYCDKDTGQQLGTQNLQCFQFDTGNSYLCARDTNKNSENYSSQIETNKNNVLEHPWDITGRFQTFQVPGGFHEGAANRGVQLECKSWRDYDQRNSKGSLSRCQFDEDLRISGHKALQVEHTITDTEIEKMGSNKKNVNSLSYERSSFQDQVCGRSLKNDWRRPSRFQPVTVSSPCVRNSIYGKPCKTNQFGPHHPFMHETFQPVSQALFTRNGQPVLRREGPPCPIGLAVMKDCNNSVHAGKRNQMENVPEMFKDARQNTYWINHRMHAINEQLSCRPKEQFKPVCITEALNFASHANNVPEMHFPTEAANKKSFGQYKGTIVALQGGSIDVATIPLPLEPPPPPPPPSTLQEQVPQLTNIHFPSTLSQIQTGAKPELQKTGTSDCISELSENQVSSTSMDLDQVSLPELDGSLKTASQVTQEKSDLLQEPKNWKYEDENKVIERECKCTPGDSTMQHEFSKERSIKEEHVLNSEVKVSNTAFSCGNCARMSRCKNSVAKCEEDKSCTNKLDQDENVTTDCSVLKSDTNESTKESQNMEIANAKAECRNDVKTTVETFKEGLYSKDDFAADKDCAYEPENMYRKSSRQINGHVRNQERLHRPWERDPWRNRKLKRYGNDLSNHPRQRYEWSLWPLYNQKTYDRCFHNKRLSGLGINTYHSNLQHHIVRERPSFSTLGYFRPWEKKGTTRLGIGLENDQARKLHRGQSTQDSTNTLQEVEYWQDYSLESNESLYNRRNVDTRNNESLKNCTFVAKKNDLMDTQEVKAEDIYNANTNIDHKVTKKNGTKPFQDSMVAVFRERPKNKESEKKCDFLMEEKRNKRKDDHKEDISQDEISGTAQNEKSVKSAMEEPNDRFAKTREDRYNHGHSYSEIVAVKSKTYQNNKKREKSIDEKLLMSKHHKKRCNLKTNTDCLDLEHKENKKKISVNSLESSNLLKGTSESDVKPTTSEISKFSHSKFAKPDFSLVNEVKGHEKIKRGLKSYKIPHLSTYKGLIKNSSKSSAKKTAEEKNALTETIRKKKVRKNNVFVKPDIIKTVKSHNKKKYGRVIEKINKLKIKTGKEKQRTQTLKSLHPKLRHKFAISSVGSDKNGQSKSEKKNLKIIVEKCDIENSVDRCKRDNDRFHYSKSKCTGNTDLNSKNETELDRLKQNPSLLTRGKFVLSTPNTFEVKEAKKLKMKETIGKRTNTSDDTEEMGTLDKALLSAKKHLLYRALAVNALKRDKTKPLAKKKLGARKSPITINMAKQEFTILKETLTTETGKSLDQKNENNDSAIKGKKFENTYKTSSVILDFPTTVYQPQRTAMGNYATQCLFGSIVSSTFYKAPGKSRVVRNSKEIVTCTTKYPDLGAGGIEPQQHFVDSEVKEVGNIETSNMDGTVPDGEIIGTSLPRRSPLVALMSANSMNSDEKRVDGNNNENLLDLRSENQSCRQEKIHHSSLETKKCSMHVGLNTGKPHFAKPETSNDEIQASRGVCDSQEKELDWKESEVEKSQLLISDNPFLQPNSDTFTVSDQFEMHRRYLKCKQELAESCSSPLDMKMLPAVVLPPVLPTLPFNTNCMSDVESKSEFPVHNSNPVPENDLDVKNTTAGECYSTNGFDINSNIEEGIAGNICMQYEPSNEEFEMYRSYQIQRTRMNVEGGVKTQYSQINNLAPSPEWKCVPEKKACFGSPYDSTKHEKNNLSRKLDYNKVQDYTSEDCYSTSENLVSADTFTDPNLSDDIFVNVSCEVNKVSDQDSILYSDASTKFDQKPNCSIMNTDEELQDTSKDLFEDLFTDILKDEELISSIPLNPPDITKGETNMLPSEKNQRNESMSRENIKKEYVSPEIPLLSPKCPQQETVENKKSLLAKYEEHKSAFKSERTPVHLRAVRKPRFEKRFPKPLPRAKSQKLTAERELYEAAERFLGDFDHSHKRSCCKDKFELLVNPFTGKMEAVKVESKKQNEKGVQSKSGELSKNQKLEIKDNKVDKNSDAKNTPQKNGLESKRSPDSCRVTRQQIAMKKSVLKPVQQKLKTKLQPDDFKSVSVKKVAQCKRSNKTKKSEVPNRRIPSIKLKAVRHARSKDMSTTGKWQVRSECDRKKEKVKSKVEDIVNFKSHKSDSVGTKRIGSILKKENDSRNEDTIQERARVWTYKRLCKVCTYTCDHHLMLKLHYEQKHPLQCYKCGNKFKDEVCNVLCSVLCLQ